MLLTASAARAELAGRFFFSPQERTALNGQRNKSIGRDTSGSSVTINGLVTNSKGKSTVWVNGIPQYDRDTSRQIAAARNSNARGEIAVKLPESTRLHPLKIGQTLTPREGEIRESSQPIPQPVAPRGANSARK